MKSCLLVVMLALAQSPDGIKNVEASVEFVELTPSEEVPVIKTWNKQPGQAKVIIRAETAPRQQMDGIGGSFNEQGWDALAALPEAKRKEVLENLFGEKGARLGFNRIPIGASDFALSAYSLDDAKDDWELKYFSITRDEKNLIPYIKAAQAINPSMKFHASPWSPPGWMKTNGSMTNGGELKSDERTLQAHAKYLVKFLEAYQKHNIIIDRLCPQNEPLVAGNYPGCKIEASLYAKAVTEFIIPEVKKSRLATEVWAGTFNYWREDTRPHFDGILAAKKMISETAGFSFQYSNTAWMKEFIAQNPDVKLQHSESECYNGANSREEACRDFQDFAAYTKLGCRLFTYWNMILPEPHKSTWGWSQNSLIVIDKEKQSAVYQPSYGVAKLLGRHIVPGAHCLSAAISSGDAHLGSLQFLPKDAVNFMQTDLTRGEQVIAFQKPDQSLVVYLLNQGESVDAEITFGKKRAIVSLPPNKFLAVILK